MSRYKYHHLSRFTWLVFGLLWLVGANADPSYDYNTLLTVNAQKQLDWVLTYFSSETVLEETEYQEVFTESFRKMPLEEFQQGSTVAGKGLRWSVYSVALSTPTLSVFYVIAATGDAATLGTDELIDGLRILTLVVVDDSSDSEDGKIADLFVAPYQAPTLPDPPESTEEAVTRLRELGHEFAYVVAEVGDGNNSCTALASNQQEEQSMPLGSMFKLYVLAAVEDAIEDGRISSWTEKIEIDEKHFNFPSGIVQADVPGSKRTVRELADLMIAISDNTATDLLMAKVGRSAVEQAMVDYGHHNPEASTPFFYGRELSILKLFGKTNSDDMPGPYGRAYLEASTAEERRRILDEDLANLTVADLNISLWIQPIEVDTLAYLASPLDICRIFSRLEKSATSREILAINPGTMKLEDYIASGLYSYIGYKGGSEPGLFGQAWYVEASLDGSIRRVVAGSLWNTERALNAEELVEASLLLNSIRDLSVSGKEDSTNSTANGAAPIARGTMWWLLSVLGLFH